MPRPVLGAFDMTKHYCRGGLQSNPMRSPDHIARPELVRADDVAHVIENLSRGARKRTKAGVAQARKKRFDRNLQSQGTVGYFERRESVHMHLRYCIFYDLQDCEVGLSAIIRMNSTLHTDFGSAPHPSLAHAASDFIRRKLV